MKCAKVLTTDDIGLHKKMVNRGATEFMCIDCLSEHFHIDKAVLLDKIEYFKKMGCTVFM